MRTSWIFEPEDLEKTPTRQSKIDGETERRYRREGVRLVFDVGQALKLDPHPTLATAAVYFHRFFMTHSFANFNRYTTALSCLFLAGKVEETPKKCKDIVVEAKEKFTDEQWNRMSKNMVEEVMMTERVLLQTIKFDLHVSHPYKFLLRYARIFRASRESVSKMVQAAWTFVNDSMCTCLCLLFEPEVIAIALMYLASRFSQVDLADWEGKRGQRGERWWDSFVENMDKSVLEEICHTVLDFYSAGSTTDNAGMRNAMAAAQAANNQTNTQTVAVPVSQTHNNNNNSTSTTSSTASRPPNTNIPNTHTQTQPPSQSTRSHVVTAVRTTQSQPAVAPVSVPVTYAAAPMPLSMAYNVPPQYPPPGYPPPHVNTRFPHAPPANGMPPLTHNPHDMRSQHYHRPPHNNMGVRFQPY